MSEAGLPISNPVSVWNKPLRADWKELFKALASGGKNLALGKWEELPGTGVEVLSSIGVQTSHGERAYLLIRRALTAAIHELVGESVAQLQRFEGDVEAAVDAFDWSVEASDLVIDRRFFEHPTRLSLLDPLKNRLSDLLAALGVGRARARVASNRLDTYFTFHLGREWRERPAVYAPLKEALEGPFATATERAQGWILYNMWLQKRTEESVFGETFSLKDVYIPLRAFWEKTLQAGGSPAADIVDPREVSTTAPGSHQKRRVAVGLHEEIESWLRQPKASAPAIRLLSGGPGSGKSTFARMLSAKVSREGDRKVLYVPLHQLDVTGDLVSAMGRFIANDRFLTGNPLDAKDGEDRLFLVLDGLDELEMQGKVGADVAYDFVDEVRRTVERRNQQEVDIRVLITGRPVATDPQQTQFRQPGQLLHALPYLVPEEEHKSYEDGELLEEDQRQLWWQAFQTCVGLEPEGLPEILARSDLDEVTRQPLLNYLLALSYQRGTIDFSRETSLNQIYEDLLGAIHERQWEAGHRAVAGLERREFHRVLEEIAVAAWHGNGRTASMRDIQNRFHQMGLEDILARFAGDAEAGVGRLLLAFYFRRAGSTESGDATFEFTHKSFGEYLVARRLVGMIETSRYRLEERAVDFDAGWDESLALEKWVELAGPTPLEENLLWFLRREVALRNHEEVLAWQQSLATLFSAALRSGLPMERLASKMGYQQMERWARNAEETLLASLNACARKTEQCSKVAWPQSTSFGDFLCRVRRQRTGPRSVALTCLSYLEAESCVLHVADLYGADLQFSRLRGSQLDLATFDNANMRGIDIAQATLWGAHLARANLTAAELPEVDLMGAHLPGANLEGANLKGANLRLAELRGANLKSAHLGKADLEGAYLKSAHLKKADLVGADLGRTNLVGANLVGANLEGANLLGANLEGANLVGANLVGANLKRANLRQATVDEAVLRAAKLQKARVQGANLTGAKVQETNLPAAGA